MNEKRNSPGFAEKLSEAQAIQLCQWLVNHTCDEAVELVAKDPPEGFGLQVSRATIGRFAQEYSNWIAEVRSENLCEAIEHFRKANSHHDIYFATGLDEVNTSIMRQQAFKLLNQWDLSPIDLQRVAKLCQTIQDLEEKRPRRGSVLIEKMTTEETNASVRQEIARKFGLDPDRELPVESHAALFAWRQNRRKAAQTQKNQSEGDGFQAAA